MIIVETDTGQQVYYIHIWSFQVLETATYQLISSKKSTLTKIEWPTIDEYNKNLAT